MAKKTDGRTFNVAVIGPSGTDKDKGQCGVGKSFLCNRFIYQDADKYQLEHISVLSQSDFAGRVINNDHFLYWGEVTKLDDGSNYNFQVIEQTEFIDDVSFQPFKTGRTTEPYYKRCVATKVQSLEKLMYICKEQLGMENDTAYEQKLMPEGKLSIDGFVCCFDVSNVKDRPIEKQVEFVALILNQALKSKKPVVLVATKCDELDERYLKEVEKLVNRKEFKGSIPLIETSSQENVNVELAFMTLAHLIDRTKPRVKAIPFIEARKAKREILAVAKEAYRNLLRQQITDPKASWNMSQKKFEKEPDFGHFVDLFGTDVAHKEFKQHTRRLREEQIKAKERKYLSQLPLVLNHFLPTLDLVEDKTWTVVQRYIEQHDEFSKYFVVVTNHEGDSWKNSDKFIDSNEQRLPFDLLSTPEADTCFRNQLNELQAKHRRRELQKQFKKVLGENKQVTPGKPLGETYVFFVGKDCYNGLGDIEKNAVYDEHQFEIKQKAKQDFQELLWEKSQVFLGLNSTGRLTAEHLKKINIALQDDIRYKMLQRLEEDRKVMILNHLGFIECPSKDRCYFKEQCIDSQVQKILAERSSRPTSQYIESAEELECNGERMLNLVLLGKEGVATELNREIRKICTEDEYVFENETYSLDYRPIDGDVSLEHNALGTANFKPHGCLCVYNSLETLEYVHTSLEQSLFSDLQREEEATMSSMQIAIIQSYKSSQSEKCREMLREEGQKLARRLHGDFIDIPDEEIEGDKSFSVKQVHEAIQSVILQGRASYPRGLFTEQTEPDIRIAMCLMCGDPLPIEVPLGPLLNNEHCQVSYNSPNTITIDSFLDCGKQKIELEISPNHGGGSLQQGIFHGYILVYSSKRRASLSTLQALVKRLPPVPKLIVCVADSGGASASFFASDISQTLIREGNALADEIIFAHYMTTTANFHQQTAVYNPFFKDAWDRKEESESLYTEPIEEPSPPAYDERSSCIDRRPPAKLPIPYEMYHNTKSSSNSQSTEDSEPIYDQPTHHPYHSDSDHERASSTSPPPEDIYSEVSDLVLNGEHLVKPSFVKTRRSQYAAAHTKDHRKSLPILESCETKLSICEGHEHSDSEPHAFAFTQLRKSSSMKLDLDEEEAWALNEPTKGMRGVATLMSACKQTSSSEEALADSSSQDIVWADNELYEGARLCSPQSNVMDGWDNPSFAESLDRKRSVMQKRSQSYGPGMIGSQPRQRGSKVTAPLALPEPIEIADYGTVKDAVMPFPENDYASVEDALPPGKLQRIKSSVRKKDKRNTDSEDSEFSSLERDVKPDRRPKTHKKPTKKGHATSFFMSKSMNDDYQQRLGIAGDASHRVRSNSPSEGSEGTGDELSHTKKPVKRKSFKHKGRYTSFGVPKIFRQQDTDYHLVGSPPRGDDESLFSNNVNTTAYSTLPRVHVTGGTVSTDDGDYDLNDSGHWRSLLKGKTYRDPEKQRKKEEKKQKDDERKKQKEEEKKQKEQLKLQKKIKKKDSKGSGPSQSGCYIEDFVMSQNNPLIPVFIERCIQFIEEEGMKAEGIYRIPGNKQQVDLLITKFNENPSAEIGSLDLEIQVNAAATVLKGFFADLTDPLIPVSLYDELIEAAGVQDKSSRLLALRGVLKKLPEQNFEVMKYLMTHLNKVTQHYKYNNMDCSNLAICWWPTIMRLEFKSYENMALHSRYPVEIVMTAIEQCNFMFHGGDEV